MMLSVTLILFILLNIIPVRVLATNGGLVTTADKTYAFDYKTHIPWVGAANSLFKASFNIPSPGTSTIDGDRFLVDLQLQLALITGMKLSKLGLFLTH
ncbi:hypothetical protein [Lactococcus petauri]|nr:hypothetical protein [Lactococcus petauri]